MAAQAIDRRLLPNRYDDRLLWGGLLTSRKALQRFLGLLVHTAFGMTLAAAYSAALPALPIRRNWLRGFLFVQAENVSLFPGVALLNAIHPEVASGNLPSLWTRRYFAVETWRHLAFGVVLGAMAVREDEP